MITKINFDEYRAYKKAKTISADLEVILKLIVSQKKALFPYQKYIPVKEIYQTMMQNQALLQLHLNKYKKIIKNKGVSE